MCVNAHVYIKENCEHVLALTVGLLMKNQTTVNDDTLVRAYISKQGLF